MPTMTSLRKGQVTEVAHSERPISSWRYLINGLVTTEGIKAFQQFLKPFGTTLVTPDGTNIRHVGNIFCTLSRKLGQTVMISVYLDRAVGQHLSTVSFVGGSDAFTDQHSTVVTQALGTGAGSITGVSGATVEVDMGSGLLNLWTSQITKHNTRVLATSIISHGVASPHIYAAGATDIEPAADVAVASYLDTKVFTQLQDIKQPAFSNASIQAPSTPFYVVLGEYACAVGGLDNELGAGVPTVLDVAHQRRKFRWASPDTINEWAPDIANIPPQYFAGYLLLPDAGEVLDVVVALSRIYVIMQRDVIEVNRVGGSVGFTQRSLKLEFNLTWYASGVCVGTPKGVYYVNDDGLYRFNGVYVEHIEASSEALFSSAWLREELGVHFLQTHRHGGHFPLVGQHVPLLDSIFWYIPAYASDAGTPNWDSVDTIDDTPLRTYVIAYNYEKSAVSILRSPVDEIWTPITGNVLGMSRYDRVTRTSKNYEFVTRQVDPETTVAVPIPVDWRMGMYSSKDFLNTLMVNRVFLQMAGAGFNALTISAELYHDETEVPFSTVYIGTLQEFVDTKWKDVRFSARFVSFVISGTVPTGSTSVLQGIGVTARVTGARF